jgi:hypothetical protein
VNAISAVQARGEFWYEIYTERLNAARFLELLKRFLRGRKRPVFLVLDSHPAHRAKLIAQHVQQLRGRLELHFLPGYAPGAEPGRIRLESPQAPRRQQEAAAQRRGVAQPCRGRPRCHPGEPSARAIVLSCAECSLY